VPSWIVKLADDAYCEWSTVVDSPVSHVLTREDALRRFDHDRIARAEEYVTSVLPGPDDPHAGMLRPSSAEAFVAGNRAGPGEIELSLADIIERYRAED
jgi:hypothetical protein